ncbi:12120_t:CDS:1 [Cetraspora pellucida]|uniref:12120_t:CDS:1 n=1 Tax=Cetraspora pellucida TaxID=1433469 RepID=A0ACA9KVI4_9GLOM|nr:12120_t:CDS:1 [Cetraspora pellucida]
MNVQLQCASVQCEHLCAHEQPLYRQIEFSEKAKKWIQENHHYHLRSSELYPYLMDNNLIRTIHTKEQVYYWASVYSKQTYITNQDNQLLSSKTYLEQSELMARGFKIISYFDNHFVRALGFIIPLFNRIGAQNINEIVIDSTFKTNQKRFELFVVNANCGGYGMPLAYLYLLTSSNLETVHHYPSDGITTRVQVLQRFFASLRQEGLLPSFVLLDKDAGEISAVSEAWSWATNLQLCY